MTVRLPVHLTAAALAALAFTAGGAQALDENKPTPTCSPNKADAAGDSADPNSGATSDSLDLVGAFVKHEPSKGAEATTANFIVKDLDPGARPDGSTSNMWVMKFTSDQPRFVRAVADYSGAVVFEHGVLVTNATGNLPRYEYRGTVPGKMWEGPGGVIQLVIPAEIGGKAGTTIKEMVVEAQGGKTVVPAAGPATPSRGLSYVFDDVSLPTWAIAACDPNAPAPAPGGAPAPAQPGTSTPPSSGGGPATTTGPTSLPVKLLTVKAAAKKAKKGRTLALKVRSSEPITGLALQIRNAKKSFGIGKLAKVSGNGTVKIKLKGALKKGKYIVDLVGKDAQGRQRSTAARFTVK